MKKVLDIPKNIFNKIKYSIDMKIKYDGIHGFLFYLAAIVAVIAGVGNLALSQVHIAIIIGLFNRIIGLYMFGFILFGLISLFGVTRLNGTRSSVLRAMFANAIAMGFGTYYLILMMKDVASQETVTYYFVYNSFITSIIVIIMYLVSIILLAVGEFVYARKQPKN